MTVYQFFLGALSAPILQREGKNEDRLLRTQATMDAEGNVMLGRKMDAEGNVMLGQKMDAEGNIMLGQKMDLLKGLDPKKQATMDAEGNIMLGRKMDLLKGPDPKKFMQKQDQFSDRLVVARCGTYTVHENLNTDVVTESCDNTNPDNPKFECIGETSLDSKYRTHYDAIGFCMTEEQRNQFQENGTVYSSYTEDEVLLEGEACGVKKKEIQLLQKTTIDDSVYIVEEIIDTKRKCDEVLPLVCSNEVDGVCRRGHGVFCSQDSAGNDASTMCVSGLCRDGICVGKPTGAQCSYMTECITGHCIAGECVDCTVTDCTENSHLAFGTIKEALGEMKSQNPALTFTSKTYENGDGPEGSDDDATKQLLEDDQQVPVPTEKPVTIQGAAEEVYQHDQQGTPTTVPIDKYFKFGAVPDKIETEFPTVRLYYRFTDKYGYTPTFDQEVFIVGFDMMTNILYGKNTQDGQAVPTDKFELQEQEKIDIYLFLILFKQSVEVFRREAHESGFAFDLIVNPIYGQLVFTIRLIGRKHGLAPDAIHSFFTEFLEYVTNKFPGEENDLILTEMLRKARITLSSGSTDHQGGPTFNAPNEYLSTVMQNSILSRNMEQRLPQDVKGVRTILKNVRNWFHVKTISDNNTYDSNTGIMLDIQAYGNIQQNTVELLMTETLDRFKLSLQVFPIRPALLRHVNINIYKQNLKPHEYNVGRVRYFINEASPYAEYSLKNSAIQHVLGILVEDYSNDIKASGNIPDMQDLKLRITPFFGLRYSYFASLTSKEVNGKDNVEKVLQIVQHFGEILEQQTSVSLENLKRVAAKRLLQTPWQLNQEWIKYATNVFNARFHETQPQEPCFYRELASVIEIQNLTLDDLVGMYNALSSQLPSQVINSRPEHGIDYLNVPKAEDIEKQYWGYYELKDNQGWYERHYRTYECTTTPEDAQELVLQIDLSEVQIINGDCVKSKRVETIDNSFTIGQCTNDKVTNPSSGIAEYITFLTGKCEGVYEDVMTASQLGEYYSFAACRQTPSTCNPPCTDKSECLLNRQRLPVCIQKGLFNKCPETGCIDGCEFGCHTGFQCAVTRPGQYECKPDQCMDVSPLHEFERKWLICDKNDNEKLHTSLVCDGLNDCTIDEISCDCERDNLVCGSPCLLPGGQSGKCNIDLECVNFEEFDKSGECNHCTRTEQCHGLGVCATPDLELCGDEKDCSCVIIPCGYCGQFCSRAVHQNEEGGITFGAGNCNRQLECVDDQVFNATAGCQCKDVDCDQNVTQDVCNDFLQSENLEGARALYQHCAQTCNLCEAIVCTDCGEPCTVKMGTSEQATGTCNAKLQCDLSPHMPASCDVPEKCIDCLRRPGYFWHDKCVTELISNSPKYDETCPKELEKGEMNPCIEYTCGYVMDLCPPCEEGYYRTTNRKTCTYEQCVKKPEAWEIGYTVSGYKQRCKKRFDMKKSVFGRWNPDLIPDVDYSSVKNTKIHTEKQRNFCQQECTLDSSCTGYEYSSGKREGKCMHWYVDIIFAGEEEERYGGDVWTCYKKGENKHGISGAATCKVENQSTRELQECVFPFKFKGVEYHKCTQNGDSDNRPWCSLDVDLNGKHVSSHWGYCGASCPGYRWNGDFIDCVELDILDNTNHGNCEVSLEDGKKIKYLTAPTLNTCLNSYSDAEAIDDEKKKQYFKLVGYTEPVYYSEKACEEMVEEVVEEVAEEEYVPDCNVTNVIDQEVMECKFPFYIGAVEHHACAPSDDEHSEGPWCPTQVAKIDGKQYYNDHQYWGYCGLDCPGGIEREFGRSCVIIMETDRYGKGGCQIPADGSKKMTYVTGPHNTCEKIFHDLVKVMDSETLQNFQGYDFPVFSSYVACSAEGVGGEVFTDEHFENEFNKNQANAVVSAEEELLADGESQNNSVGEEDLGWAQDGVTDIENHYNDNTMEEYMQGRSDLLIILPDGSELTDPEDIVVEMKTLRETFGELLFYNHRKIIEKNDNVETCRVIARFEATILEKNGQIHFTFILPKDTVNAQLIKIKIELEGLDIPVSADLRPQTNAEGVLSFWGRLQEENMLNNYENFATCHYSLDYMLGLLVISSGGETQKRILSILNDFFHVPNSFQEGFIDYFKKIWTSRNNSQSLASASRIYDLSGTMILKDEFGAKARDLGIISETESIDDLIHTIPENWQGTSDEINDFVNEETHELIPEMIEKDFPIEGDVITSINTIVLNTTWVKPFMYESNTRTFMMPLIDGEERYQEMRMITSVQNIPYYTKDTENVISLPLGQEGRYHIWLLISQNPDLEAQQAQNILINSLTMPKQLVRIVMPEFEIKNTVNVAKILKMGPPPFDPSSSKTSELDFSNIGIIDLEDSSIPKILQKNVIHVTKDGLSAASIVQGSIRNNNLSEDMGDEEIAPMEDESPLMQRLRMRDEIDASAPSEEDTEVAPIEIVFDKPFYFSIVDTQGFIPISLFSGSVHIPKISNFQGPSDYGIDAEMQFDDTDSSMQSGSTETAVLSDNTDSSMQSGSTETAVLSDNTYTADQTIMENNDTIDEGDDATDPGMTGNPN